MALRIVVMERNNILQYCINSSFFSPFPRDLVPQALTPSWYCQDFETQGWENSFRKRVLNTHSLACSIKVQNIWEEGEPKADAKTMGLEMESRRHTAPHRVFSQLSHVCSWVITRGVLNSKARIWLSAFSALCCQFTLKTVIEND